MRRLRFTLFLLLVICLSTAGLGQQRSPVIAENQSKDSAIKIETRLVSVPVAVVDRDGHYFPQLESSNFELYDDGIKQKIEFFSHEDAPLSIGIVYDLSGSMKTRQQRSLAALQKFLEGIHREDEFFTVGVSSRPLLLNDFTNDPKAITSQVSFREARGKTALFDAVYLSLEKLRQGKSKRRMLIVISDGQDNNSRYAFRELRSYIQESDVQLYAVGISGVWGFNNDLALQGRAILRDLTALTGGEAIFTPDENELGSALDMIDAAMRSQYNLAFTVPATSQDARWHKLKVRLVNLDADKAKSLSVLSRIGYQSGR